jgi:hypothetical protein
MRVKQCRAQATKVAVLGVVDFHDTPRVSAGTDELTVNLDLLFGADDGKGKKSLIGQQLQSERCEKQEQTVDRTLSSLLSWIVSSSSSSTSYGKL